MVAREFLNRLETTQQVFEWTRVGKNHIRAFLKSGPASTSFDPIAAVAFLASGQKFAEGDWTRAGNAIGLSARDSAAIIDASNDKLWKYVDDQLVLDGYSEWLRDGIALAVGLETGDAADPETQGQVDSAELATTIPASGVDSSSPSTKPRHVA